VPVLVAMNLIEVDLIVAPQGTPQQIEPTRTGRLGRQRKTPLNPIIGRSFARSIL